MVTKDNIKNMNLQIPEKTYSLVFNKALDMSKEKKRKVPLKEAVIHIIDEWGKNQTK